FRRTATTEFYALSLPDALPISLVVRTRAHLPVDLRRQDHLVAPVLQGLAHDLLGPALAIDVGGVDEVDPGVERRMDHADALVLVDRKSTRLNSSHEWISYAVFC